MSNIYTKEILLTPELAKEYLRNNDPRQRHINYGWSKTMARDIVSGRWIEELQQEAIDFNTDGLMQNGQHRCMAVIYAQTPVKAKVRYNCPKEWFETYDRNKARTANDFYRGKHAKIIIGLATFAICIGEKSTLLNAVHGTISHANSHIHPSLSEKLDFIHQHEDVLAEYAYMATKIRRALGGGSEVGYADALWLLKTIGVPKDDLDVIVADFCESMTLNKNLVQIKLWAMKTLMQFKSNKIAPRAEWSASVVLACYDAYYDASSIKQVKRYVEKSWAKYTAIIEERTH